MVLEALANPLCNGQLKAEPRNDADRCSLVPRSIDEIDRMTRDGQA
jgi:hypothetical protein